MSLICANCGDRFTDETFYLHNCRIKNKEKKMNLFTRYTNGQDEYCIHGMCMTSKCESCEEIRKQEIQEMNEKKMTREEAVKIAETVGNTNPWYEADIDLLEKLGLLKFDEPKEVNKIFELKMDSSWRIADRAAVLNPIIEKHGVIRLEEWPEGLVLWVGGEIVWKSWEQPIKIGDFVTGYHAGSHQEYEVRIIRKGAG